MVLATFTTYLHIVAEPLTPDSFAPFGGVISSAHQLEKVQSESANYGTATKLLKVSPIANKYADCPSSTPATANWNLFRCSPPAHLIVPSQDKPGAFDYTSKVLERHPFSTQTFLPLGRDKSDIAYMVIVAPTGPDGLPVIEQTKAFLAKGDQAVTYGVATWHAPMIALGETVDFGVLIHENGVPDEDVQEVYLDALTIEYSTGPALAANATSGIKPKRRKSQSQEAWEQQLDQFQGEGPVVQNEDYFDHTQKGASAKIDINRIKYAAERQFYKGNYQEAARIVESNLHSLKGKMAQDLLAILHAAKHRM